MRLAIIPPPVLLHQAEAHIIITTKCVLQYNKNRWSYPNIPPVKRWGKGGGRDGSWEHDPKPLELITLGSLLKSDTVLRENNETITHLAEVLSVIIHAYGSEEVASQYENLA